MARRGLGWGLLALVLACAPAAAVRAALQVGPLELSGAVDSQTLLRASQIDNWQFVQNRNTALLRLDAAWLEHGRFLDRLDVPGVRRSRLYLLYRGVYDSFWSIAPGGEQKGVTGFDDQVGGPVAGHRLGTVRTSGCAEGLVPCPRAGPYSRISSTARRGLAFENTLREAYIDLTLADVPLSLRLGRQQIIWGESDQFRLMDVINPLDTTWHLQQEEWDKLRIPLWLVKAVWDAGELGPLRETFAELVFNPGDFQPTKVRFLPSPWAAPVPNPTRAGQIQVASPTIPVLFTPRFDLRGTSIRQGDFSRTVAQAAEVGLRLHAVSDVPWLALEGLEYTANYYYGRGRGIGAVAGAPFGLDVQSVTIDTTSPLRQDPDDPGSPPALFDGAAVFPADVVAEYVFPYTSIAGVTGNYFEPRSESVLRLEMAYQFDAPFQSAARADRVPVRDQNGAVVPDYFAPLGYTTRDVWAGMLGVDRPTWIRLLNPHATWFLTGQFFWSYVNGGHSMLRGALLSAGEQPYFTPRDNAGLPAALRRNGVGRWTNGPFAGQTERTQNAAYAGGTGNQVYQWELLTTLAATSFYAGGTIVPFVAVAIDPVNRNLLSQTRLDYLPTDHLVVQLRLNLYSTLGSGRASLDPWGAGGLNARRDEVGLRLAYQF